jgi:hypothetical protein
MLGLAVVVAAAVTAFVGATSATAADFITLCKVEVKAGNLCPEGELLEKGVTLKAKALKPTLSGTVTVECPESVVEGKTLAKSETPLPFDITNLTFGPAGKCSNCPTVDVEGLPWQGNITVTGTGAEEEFFVTAEGSAKLLGCFGFVNCLFKTPAGGAKLLVENNTNGFPKAVAKNVKLVGPGGLCGTEGEWNATYTFEGTKFWVALDKLLAL